MSKSTDRKFDRFFKYVETLKKEARTAAWLGDLLNNTLTDGGGLFYATLITGQVVKVKNNKAPAIMGWPVILGYLAGSPLLQVIESREVFSEQSLPDVPSHAETHQWPGIDPLWVRGEQILPGLFVPSSGLILQAYSFIYYILSATANGFHLLPNQTIDLTDQIPTSGANFVLIEIDPDGVLSYNAGASVNSRSLLSVEDIPAPTSGYYPLVAVKMYVGQTGIIKNLIDTDVFDLRWSGYGSGGVASGANWADLIGKPTTWDILWAELTGASAGVQAIGDPRYPRIYEAAVPPTINDDSGAGYKKGDIWIDTAGLLAYKAIDVTVGAAVWLPTGAGSDVEFNVDGALVVIASASVPFLVTKTMRVQKWYIYCETPGTASSTIVDINKNGTTVFTTQANRPALAFNDADGWASGVPDVQAYVEGDVISLDIDQVATGAAGLIIIGLVANSTGGDASVSPDYIYLRDEKAVGTDGGASVANTWTKRTINTEVSDVGGHCSIASDQITLAAGTYRCNARAPFFNAVALKLRLRNITGSVTTLVGTSNYDGPNIGGSATIIGEFTIALSTVFELQYIVQQAQATYGLGPNTDTRAPNSNEVEIYAEIEFWKVG